MILTKISKGVKRLKKYDKRVLGGLGKQVLNIGQRTLRKSVPGLSQIVKSGKSIGKSLSKTGLTSALTKLIKEGKVDPKRGDVIEIMKLITNLREG